GSKPVAPANFADWKAQNQAFEDMSGIRNQFLNLTGSGEPVQLEAHFVTGNLFPLLGVKPALGRFFTAEEDQPGTAKVAVLSYRLWRQNFGADPGAVGRSIFLDDEKYTVVGILPRDFFFDPNADVWAPIALSSR